MAVRQARWKLTGTQNLMRIGLNLASSGCAAASNLWGTKPKERGDNVLSMTIIRHFSDTRTEQGRVRFLLSAHGVQLLAETQGWMHSSTHATLHDAATFLALLPQVSQTLYDEALSELERRLAFEKQSPSAA